MERFRSALLCERCMHCRESPGTCLLLPGPRNQPRSGIAHDGAEPCRRVSGLVTSVAARAMPEPDKRAATSGRCPRLVLMIGCLAPRRPPPPGLMFSTDDSVHVASFVEKRRTGGGARRSPHTPHCVMMPAAHRCCGVDQPGVCEKCAPYGVWMEDGKQQAATRTAVDRQVPAG